MWTGCRCHPRLHEGRSRNLDRGHPHGCTQLCQQSSFDGRCRLYQLKKYEYEEYIVSSTTRRDLSFRALLSKLQHLVNPTRTLSCSVALMPFFHGILLRRPASLLHSSTARSDLVISTPSIATDNVFSTPSVRQVKIDIPVWGVDEWHAFAPEGGDHPTKEDVVLGLCRRHGVT